MASRRDRAGVPNDQLLPVRGRRRTPRPPGNAGLDPAFYQEGGLDPEVGRSGRAPAYGSGGKFGRKGVGRGFTPVGSPGSGGGGGGDPVLGPGNVRPVPVSGPGSLGVDPTGKMMMMQMMGKADFGSRGSAPRVAGTGYYRPGGRSDFSSR